MSKQGAEIRIYVACLAAYNSGILHGCWIDACQDEGAICAEIAAMLKESPEPGAEEYAVHDHEGFEGAPIEEYSSIKTLCTLAAFIAEHGALGGKLLGHYGDIEEAKAALEDHYCGLYKSVADYAEELTAQTTEIPEALRYYIDYERMARDLEINDILSIETSFEQVHVFWRH